MSQPSNIRQLLTDSKLGLLPEIDNTIKEIENTFHTQQQNVQLRPYDLLLGNCTTIAANEPRPLITQSITLKFLIIGSAKEKFELLVKAIGIAKHSRCDNLCME